MTEAEQKLHDKASQRLIKVWTELHGFPPRTFKLEDWTINEINTFIDEEIAEHSVKKT